MVDEPTQPTPPAAILRAPDGTPEPGSLLAGKYRVMRRLGEGGEEGNKETQEKRG